MILFCCRCRHHLPVVKGVKRNGESDTDVCGMSMTLVRDEVGNLRFETHGDVQHCEECGQVTQDNRKVKYYRCQEQNKKYKCQDFQPKIRWWVPFLLGRFHRKAK